MSLKSYVNRKLTRLVVRCSRNRYNRLFTWYCILTLSICLGNKPNICPLHFMDALVCLPDGAIVTAGSLVNKDFSAKESSTMFAGIPAVPTSKRCILLRNNDQLLFDFFEVHPTSVFRVINANDFLYNKKL